MIPVFDFGGVLFQWRPALLLQRVLPARLPTLAQATQMAADFFQSYGGDWAEFDRGTLTPSELAVRIAARTGLSVAEVTAVVDAVPDELAPIAASLDLLARLRAATRALGRPMFFLSNMPAPFADHLEHTHGFLRQFDAGVFSARVKLIKPEPEIFALAVQRFGVPPAELLFFDDHAPNVQAARAAGWQAIQFSSAAQAEADMRNQGFWPA